MDNQSGWVVGGASSIGCRHIEENTPIEDNCITNRGVMAGESPLSVMAQEAEKNRLLAHDS